MTKSILLRYLSSRDDKLFRVLTEIVTQLAGLRRGQSSQQSAIDTQTAMIETATQAANGSQPDTCLLCGRRANDVYTVEDFFKLAYGLCWTCSAKPASHVMACDVIARLLPKATVMSRSLQ